MAITSGWQVTQMVTSYKGIYRCTARVGGLFQLSNIGWFMVFNATFNNNSAISWRSDRLVQETRVHGENHRPVASH